MIHPLIKKIAGGLGILAVLMGFATPLFAQGTFDAQILDDIKGRLEAEGISLIDYSLPEERWGALDMEWIARLTDFGSNSLPDFARLFETYYQREVPAEGEVGSITYLRSSIAQMQARLSQLNDMEAIEGLKDEIESEKIELLIQEESLKDEISTVVMGILSPEEPDQSEIEDGINLLYGEVDFFYSHSRWGGIPSRIYGIVELNTGYASLQDIVSVINENPENKEEALNALRDQFINIDGLSTSDVNLILDTAVFSASGRSGEAQVNQIGLTAAGVIQNVAGGLAILWIIVAGVRMILADGDENTLSEQKRAILYGVIGLVIILIMRPLISSLYGVPGEIRTDLISAQDEGFSLEILGIVSFLRAVIGTVAIFYIVMSGVRMLFAQGDEDTTKKLRTSIIWIGTGLILIAINEVLINNIFVFPTQQGDQISTQGVASIINTLGTVLQFILGFVGIIAFGILVYGGAMMIMNFGNDETVDKAKKIIRNALMGIIVIISAFVIVASLVTFG